VIDNVVVAVPEMLQALYVLPTSRPPADLQEWPAMAAARVDQPLRELVEHIVTSGMLAVDVRAAGELPPWPAEVLQAFGAGESALALLTSASHAILVQSWFRPGWPPAHEWTARVVAGQLAARLDVPVFDVFTPRLVDADTLLHSLPDAERVLRLTEWVLVPQSAGPAGLWLTTKGLGRFGLPELQAVDVPPQFGGAWTNVLSGLGSRLLTLWSQALEEQCQQGDGPAFVTLPGELEIGEPDVAQAYGRPSRGKGSARVALRLDPSSDLDQDVFLTVVPPASFPASAGEFVAQVCAQLFGGEDPDIRYVSSTAAMQEAMARARHGLPQVRQRLVDGEIPLGAQLMVKHRLDAPDGAEYVWAFITSWSDPARLVGTCADDAAHHPGVRAGRPVRVDVDAVVDWAVWVDGQGMVEGGFTNAVLGAD
jgi:uncharacterized protein YegJ (DUF2314 family)